jgi:hypothetical protein
LGTTLSNPIGICLVLLGLVVMPVAVLVLVFDVGIHLGHGGSTSFQTLYFPSLRIAILP